MGNKTSSFRGAWGGQPRVPCGGSALRSQSHRRLTYKSPQSQVHYSIPLPSIHALPSTQGRAQECVAEMTPQCQLKSFSHSWGFLSSGSFICGTIGVFNIVFLSNNSVFLIETGCLCYCLYEAVKRWLSVGLLFFFKDGPQLPNNPFSAWGYPLGTLFSKHKSLRKIVLSAVTRAGGGKKSAVWAGDNSFNWEHRLGVLEKWDQKKEKRPFCSS